MKIQDFVVNDLSRTYVKMTRDRDDTKTIVSECLEKISLLLAPFAPYISEYVHSAFSKQSVHLSRWPEAKRKMIDKNLEREMGDVLGIIEKGMAERDKAGINLRWPLKSAIITADIDLKGQYHGIIKSQLNVKEISFKRTARNGSKESGVELDKSPSRELEAEGFAREISRQVQAFRKDLGLNKKDPISLLLIADAELEKMLEMQSEFIMQRTNSRRLEIKGENVTTGKERFKNEREFQVKNKRGKMLVDITTKK